MKSVKYFSLNYGLQLLVICIGFALAVVGCNNLPTEQKQPELKPSNFAAPIVDTIAVVPDSNAYIINSK